MMKNSIYILREEDRQTAISEFSLHLSVINPLLLFYSYFTEG